MAYFLSPAGADSNPGTSAEPWQSWSFAVARLNPGDTLIAKDGTWTTNVSIDCSSSGNAHNGQLGAPITLRAQNERQARILQLDSEADVFRIANCSYWNVEGLHMQGLNDASGCPRTVGVLIDISTDTNMIVRRNIVDHLNADRNIAAIFVGYDSDHVLVEENEVYDFGPESPCPSGCNCNNKAIQVYFSTNVEIRRNYVNPRNEGALEAINPYPAGGVLVENNICEHCGTSFSVNPNRFSTMDSGIPDNNKFLGNVALGAVGFGFFWADRCTEGSPCLPPSDQVIENNYYKDNVSVGARQIGVYDRGAWGNIVENFTDINSADEGYAYDIGSENLGTVTKTTLRGFLCSGAGRYGIYVGSGFGTPPFTFLCDHCVANGRATNFLPALPDPHFVESSSVAPTLIGTGQNQCVVYVPGGNRGANPTINGQSSNMAGTGANGDDIGANIIYAYEGGALTSQKLWNQTTGRFPCGAVVAGLNDDPNGGTTNSNACISAHRRLNVGVNGCAIP